jgi:hypothetical protein
VSEASLGKGGFLQVSGVSFTYDPAKPSGGRLVGEIRRPGGGVVRPEDSLRVTFPGYPACHGGDGYTLPEAKASCTAEREAPRAADLLTRYVTDSLQGSIQAPPDGRIVRAGNTNPG